MNASIPTNWREAEREEHPLGSALNPASLDDDMGFEDDLVPLDHPVMRESFVRWNDARMSDAELVAHSKDQRKFEREAR